MTYNLRTDRTVTAEPVLPAIGSAGNSFVDPTFGTKITRVTDSEFSKSIGAPTRSWMSGSGGEQNTWNKDGTAFIIQGLGGEWVPFSLTGKIATPNNFHGLPINDPAFSYNDPDLLYGKMNDGKTLCKYSLSAQTKVPIIDLPSSAVGEVSPSANDRLASYGKGGQDLATEVYVWSGSTLLILDTIMGKVNGQTISVSGLNWGFGVHNVRLDKSGRFAVITASQSLANAGTPLVVWDIDQQQIYAIGPSPFGHKVGGFGSFINQDTAGGTWDDMQFVFRKLDAPSSIKNLITQVIRPARTMISPFALGQDCHLSWNNHQGGNEPVLISGYRDAGYPDIWRTWDNEIILVSTDGSGTVYRVCHHRTKYEHFWDGPHAVISPDGSKAVFTSNWGKSLGIGEDGESRRDVFRVDLVQSGLPPSPAEVLISGKIVKKDGSPLPGVRVMINPGTAVKFTKPDGSFEFKVKPGNYTIIAGASNNWWVYNPCYRCIKITQDTTGVDFAATASNDPSLFT